MVLGAVAVVVVLAFAGLAAGSGNWASAPAAASSSSTSPAPAPGTLGPVPADPTPASVPDRQPAERSELSGYAVLGIAALLVLGGLALVARRSRSARWFRPRRPATAQIPEGTTNSPADMPQAVDRALLAVGVPDAREAVVQAWLLLCAAAAAAGTPARPAETAEEYGRRLSAVHELPAPPVRRLAELYREARFSAHPVGPEQRERARTELETLRAALAVPGGTAAR